MTSASVSAVSRWSYGDWDNLAGLDRIMAVYEVGENSVVVDTREGREIRITAWHDLSTDQYIAEYERRSRLTSGGQELDVWVHTPAYRRCRTDDFEACMEEAVLEVDRVHVC